MKNFKLNFFQITFHAAAFGAFVFNVQLNWVIIIFMYFILQVVGIGVGMHRLFSHSSFKTSLALECIIGFFSVLCLVGSPISWAGIHRYHHLVSDEKKDPHSPHYNNWISIFLSTWYRNVSVSPRLVRDLMNKTNLKFLHRYYYHIIILWMLLISALDWRLLFSVYIIPVVLVFNFINLGLILNHKFGYRNFSTKDFSTNNIFVSLYTLGEGWHNNHHHSPRSWDNRCKWWEFDLPAILIKNLFINKEISRND